jgi:hypothetical protein
MKYNPFEPLTLSAQELAEGYVQFCEDHRLTGKTSDQYEDYMLAMHHSAGIGQFELCVDACEIIAETHPDSAAYEQILLGPFGDLLNSLSKYEQESISHLTEKITKSKPLRTLARELPTKFLDDEAKCLLESLLTQINTMKNRDMKT